MQNVSLVAGPVIAIHAGAAAGSSIVVEAEERCRGALLDALADGRAVLENGGDALSAVQAAVMVMEDFELFNAGHGAVLCADGTIELSASLMASDRSAGAVAAVKRTKNPITGALAVLRSDQVLMFGEAADRRAADAGAEQVDPSYFVTERQRARLMAQQTGADHATVGAVCVDARGRLAAATSTGGIRSQPPGRVGDTPVLGAGTWADTAVAVSCTGDGEVFIRAGVARYIGALLERGLPLSEACDRALAQVRELGGAGGLVAVDAQGFAALPFLTPVMPRGIWRAGGEPVAWVGESAAASLAV
jgi:L-asparaginase / beta-aspartyl-peptidase